ncbi:ankyrin [Aspergillus campestris IBT 28561]|uniref:Ankyrin n=1 Tax=Aspergillus campestris (strain IBT 28561) TaxID=1392248 RepID=A0A2I1D7X0_ASPC2|nr:ankyrin [Aspergillus campestris IBT 28561]PKY05981.1 ankyrin [Aspergillus campestris IBT 28561]
MFAPPPSDSQHSSVEDLVAELRNYLRYKEYTLISSIVRNKTTIDLPVNSRTALSYAAETPYTDCVRILLQYSHPSTIDKPDATGRTALSYAATAEVKHKKAGVKQINKNLWISLGPGRDLKSLSRENIRLLIDKNADPRSRDQTGRTPLSWAAGMGCKETVEFFCNEYKEDDAVFAADHGGRSPVSYAAQAGNHDIVRKLFDTKRNYDDCDHENRTPLYWCLHQQWKNDEYKGKTISRQAAMYSCLPPDFDPKHRQKMPAKSSDQGIVKILNQSVKGKMTLLSEAVMRDDEYAVKALMGIPHFTCDATNEEGGQTALILALCYDKKSMFRSLWGNLGRSLEQIKRHPSPAISFQRFLEVGKGWLNYSQLEHKDLSKIRQFLRASIEELLQYKEVEMVEQLLGRLIDTLQVPLYELNWVISSGISLREAVANIKQIGILHVLLEHGVDPAMLCLTGKWFNIRPIENANTTEHSRYRRLHVKLHVKLQVKPE